MQAKLFIEANCILGESPMWHKERNSIWWVDIEKGDFFECDILTRNIKNYKVPQPLSLLVQSAKDSDILLVAVADGVLRFNIVTNKFESVLFLEKTIAANRTNDGNCDAAGRLWLGTMEKNCAAGAGKLYCIETDGTVSVKINFSTIPNGLCWNFPQDKMYYIDSAAYEVQSYFFDVITAGIAFDKTAIEVPQNLGMPDGMAIDEEGMLWIAHWGGFSVNRWNPATGKHIETIEVPAPNVTSCAFGGANMNQLFITTARAGMSEAELEIYPLSGSVFYADLGVKGIPKNKCML